MTHLIFQSRTKVALSLFAALVVAILFVPSSTVSAQATFDPQQSASLSTADPGATSDLHTSFDLPVGDVLFAGVVAFSPPEAGAPGDAPLGAVVGELKSQATLGIANGACSNKLGVDFTFLNATTDTANVVEPPPVFGPNGDPVPDRLNILASDIAFLDDDNMPAPPGAGRQIGESDFLPIGVELYPSFLNDLFPGLKPRARLFAATFIPSADLTAVLQFVVFEPGTQIPPTDLIPNPPSFDPRLGYPSVTVLLDPSAEATESAVTDFCSPLTTDTTVFGVSKDNPATPDANEGGSTIRTNPGAGTDMDLVIYAVGQRDADGDGFENFFDTCPYDPNKEDARSPGGDPDRDGIDSSCDGAPNDRCYPNNPGVQPTDCDGDFWPNRGDNCPQTPNRDQKDADGDLIGDVCDRSPNSPDGALIEVCKTQTISIPGDGQGTTASPPTDDQGRALQPCGDAPIGPPGEEPTPTATATPTDGDDGDNGDTTVTPTPTAVAGSGSDPDDDTGGGGGGGAGGGTGGPDTGVGSLAPAVSSVPIWATILSGLGGAGLLGSLCAFVSRIRRRRD